MITVRKNASSGVTGHVSTRTATTSLPPILSNLMRERESVPRLVPKKKHKQIVAHDKALTAGMRRIFEQYRAGTYSASDFSVRTAQRHRKFFLSIGIDLRKPYSLSATVRVSVPESLPKPRAKPVPVKKKKMGQPLAPESASTTSAKSKCVSEVIARVHKARVQLRRTAITTGLGALAHRAR